MTDLFDSPADNGDIAKRLDADIADAGGPMAPEPEFAEQIGVTMFDLPGSEDNTVTVLLSRAQLERAPSQALVRIKSRRDGDGRSYLGIVTAGPFAEPDSLRGDSHLLQTLAVRGGSFQPPFHGRVQVTLLGEELDGALAPPRLRPLPNSPVIPLNDRESAQVLKADGDLRLGVVVGYEEVVLGVPSDQKNVLPRHTAILGTTGGGKSNTVARLVQQAQAAGMSVILLDVEGEYTRMHLPTKNPKMQAALASRGLQPAGLPADRMTLYHLVGRDSANPEHPNLRPFSLQFARLSPYAAAEILGLTDAQMQRFLKAYDVARELLREFGIFPAKGNAEQERMAIEIDEFERGYPRLTLALLLDIVASGGHLAEGGSKDKEEGESSALPVKFTPYLKTAEGQRSLRRKLMSVARPDHAISWRALLGRLGRLNRLKVFFDDADTGAQPLIYKQLLRPGMVNVLDLSDSGVSELNNLVIADLLRGVQEAQEDAFVEYERLKKSGQAISPPKVLVVIEEAHEFLNDDRIEKMKILFEQVARIAKRGRKRWLGLTFVTQLPQHLPRQLFGLVNSFVLHKISDPQVIGTLRRTVSGIDEGLWNRLPGLAPGQAIVSFPHMARPLLVSIDAAPGELRLIE